MYALQSLGILVRLLAVTFLVAASYNPTGYSYVHWAFGDTTQPLVLKIFLGLNIVVAFVYCVQATLRSLYIYGIIPLLLVIGTTIWLASDLGLVDLAEPTQRILVFEAGLVALLGTGVCFSHIRYRLGGQMDSRTLT